jgi:hypothetical protein
MMDEIIVTSLHDYNDYKTRETQMHRMGEQGGCVLWCFHLSYEILEPWPFLTLNWKLWQINWYQNKIWKINSNHVAIFQKEKVKDALTYRENGFLFYLKNFVQV